MHHNKIKTPISSLGDAVCGLFNARHGAVDTIIGWEVAGLATLPLVDVGLRANLHPDPIFNLLQLLPDEQHAYTIAIMGAKTSTGHHVEQLFGHAGHRRDSLNQWHRYISRTIDNEQAAAFPDKTVTLGSTGTPLAGEEITKGQEVYVIAA
jgi:DUF917 family protein